MEYLIYVADDDSICRDLIQELLELEGYKVRAFETGDQLYIAFMNQPADLVTLDAVMPGNDGIKVCSMLRKQSDVPIIILTALDTDDDYYTGISQGGDIYLTKPFNANMLRASVKALLVKSERKTPQGMANAEARHCGDIIIYPSQLTAFCNGTDMKLTHTELKLLSYMFETYPRAIAREEFLTNVWGYDNTSIETRATDDTVKRLRKKLLAHSSNVQIESVWGHGFKLIVTEDE